MLFSKLHQLIYFQLERYASKDAFNHKVLGRWEARSTTHFIQQMNELSTGLIQMGVQKGDRIGIFSSYSSPEWLIIDMACLELGLITVPINPGYSDEELFYILDQVDPAFCFVNEDLLADQLMRNGIHKTKLISFGNSIRYKSWNDVRVRPEAIDRPAIDAFEAEIKEDDVATIIYTSGSTGLPKGVMLTHKNVISNIKSIITLVPVSYKDRVASFLPLSHIFERMVLFTYVAIGAKIHFIQNPKELVKYMQEIKPHYISSVPRILEKVYNHIQLRVKKSNPVIRRIVRMAMKLGEKEKRKGIDWLFYPFKIQIADFLVYRRWRKIMGGHLKGIMVGAASMDPKIARLYTRAGIPIREGYGLTETSPVVSFNRFEPGGTRYGTVGIPIPGVQVKIFEPDDTGAGEILVKGPNVMKGYYKNEKLTKEKIDPKGWFHTGDIGYFKHDRFLCISDRKKDIFKTSSGQYVYPQKIENILKIHPAIDQCMIIGFQKAYVSTLIVPDFPYLKSWCKNQGIHWTAELYMIENDRVKKYYVNIINEINEKLKPFERIKSHTLLPKEWSIETEEYTPTLKLRRAVILDKYESKINQMYN